MITKYVGNILCALETGHVFVIAGKTIDGATRLDINFKSGNLEDEDDIPLQISVRFDQDAVVRNTRQSGEWGAEERDENRNAFTVGNPLVAGEIFKVYIFVSDYSFHIAFNDEAFCTYAFRIAVQEIRTVEVTQDLQAIVQMDHRATFPTPMPVVQRSFGEHVPEDGRLEFSNDCPRRFTPGHVIVLTAIPYGNSRGFFVVRFTEGLTRKQALHFSARFEPENVVVRNSTSDKLEYGVEERDGAFPFFIDEQFKLAIAIGTNEFKFAVNGQLFATFAYRSANLLERLNGMQIVAGNGMHMEVTGVDHMHTGDVECGDFQKFTDPGMNVLYWTDR